MTTGFSKLGVPFLIDTPVAGTQDAAIIVSLTGGGFVVSWISQHQDGSYDGVYARLYGADILPIGSEFQVNTRSENDQNNHAVTALSGGGFVVTWYSASDDSGLGQGTYAQIYDSNGAPSGAEIFMRTANNDPTSVSALSDGGFLVFYTGLNNSTFTQGVQAQRFSDTGAALGLSFTINTYDFGTQDQPKATLLADGSFIVTWTSYLQDSNGEGVFAQMFNADNTPLGGEFQVNNYTFGDQNTPEVTALEAGGFVVVWTSHGGQDGFDAGVFGQRYDEAGLALDAEFQINTSFIGTQSDGKVTALPDGGFVVVWHGRGGLGFDSVFGQRFDASGATIGGEILIASDAIERSANPSVTTLEDGSFVVTWQSWTNTNIDIYAQHFEAQLYGTASGETMIDATGVNWISGEAGDDTLKGLAGQDTLYGEAGADTLIGGANRDKLFGGIGRDTLKGGAGNDKLKGQGGADILIGGVGRDTMFGGAGNDTFVFTQATDSTAAKTDTIKDFTIGADLIDLSALSLTFIGTAAFSGAAEVRLDTSGTDTVIYADTDGDGTADMKIRVLEDGLTAADFIL